MVTMWKAEYWKKKLNKFIGNRIFIKSLEGIYDLTKKEIDFSCRKVNSQSGPSRGGLSHFSPHSYHRSVGNSLANINADGLFFFLFMVFKKYFVGIFDDFFFVFKLIYVISWVLSQQSVGKN